MGEKTRKTRMAGKQGQMFEASWERIDSARNPDLYETKDGVTFLRGNQQQQEDDNVMQTLTEEELRNVEKAAEKMNDREDQILIHSLFSLLNAFKIFCVLF